MKKGSVTIYPSMLEEKERQEVVRFYGCITAPCSDFLAKLYGGKTHVADFENETWNYDLFFRDIPYRLNDLNI